MRKTRLKILPAHCLAHIGFLLLYLSCPILAEMSRGQPDHGLDSSYQFQVLEHCASPPEDPGDGGCTNHRNAQTKMTRPEPPDNEHHATCSTSEVFKLENTCSMEQRPSDDSDGRPKPATRYARRLLAARSKDQSASTPKIYAPREVKYRSLKRHHVSEEIPKSVESQVSADRRTLSLSRYSLTASRTSSERNSRSSERDANRRTAKRFLSRRVSTLDVTRRLAERQSPSRTTSERRSSERDLSRRIATERLSIRRTSTERTYANTDDSRKTSTERLNQKTAESRMSSVEISRRISPERQSTRRTSLERKLSESDGNRRVTERQSTHRIASERRMAESRGMSVDRKSTRKTSPERKMTDHEISRRTQNERRSDIRFAHRRVSSERVSVIPVPSRTSSERKDGDVRVSHNLSSYRRQADYRDIEGQISRHSNELLNSEQRSNSRKTLSERRNVSEQSPYRRNSLDSTRSSEERLSNRRISETRHDAERRNTIRRTTRSVSPERRVYSQRSIDRHDSRTLPSERIHEIRSSTRISADRELPEIRLSRDHRSNEFRRNTITSRATERASLSRRRANIEQRSFRRNSLPESRTAERSRFSRSISKSKLDSESRNSIQRTIQSISPEHRMSFQASVERLESHSLSPASIRMSSPERVSNMRSGVVVERKLADARELPSYHRQKESRQVPVVTDRSQPSRRSSERLDSERQLSSRRNQQKERRISSQRSYKKNYLHETRNSVERRLTRSVSEARLSVERRNTIRRTTRSVSIERRVSVDRHESRTMTPSSTRVSSERVSDVRSGKVAERQLTDTRVLPDYRQKMESRRVSVITERSLANRRSSERQNSERQFNSRRISTEERKLSGQRSHTRNSLREMYNSAGRRLTRTFSNTRIDAEQRNTVRRTTRSLSPESRISVDRRESRALSFSRAVMPTERLSVSRSSNTDSRRMSLDDRKLSGQRSYRRNSLDELHNSAGRRLTRAVSDTRLDVEQRNTIRRTTRSVSPESRISVDRRESTPLSSARITMPSQRVSDVRYKSKITAERKSVDMPSYHHQTDSRRASITERSLANRRSSERLNSERQLHSRKIQLEERRVSDRRTHRRNSLNSAERRFTRSNSETRLDSEQRNTIRRTTRSVSPERRQSSEVSLIHRSSRAVVRADRDKETRMTDRLVSRRSNELRISQRMAAESQSSRRMTFERRSSTQRLTFQKALAAERRMSDLIASRRNSNERLSSRRTPVRLSGTIKSERISTERRLGDLTLERSSVERRSTSPVRRMSTVPDESRRASMSERLAKIKSTFTISVDRRSDTRLHRSLSSERQAESGAVSLADRRASERVMAQRSVSRISQSEDRHLPELRSYRINSLEGIRTSSERRSARSVSKTHFDSDTRNAIRRTTRSVSSDRRHSMGLISQRSSPRLSEERRNMKQSRERLNYDRQIGSHQMRDVRLSLDNSISRTAADRKLSVERRDVTNRKSTDRREHDERSNIKLSRDRSSTLSSNNRAPEEKLSTRRDSRLATERASTSRDSRRTSVERLSLIRNTRLTERLSVARNSRRTSEVLESRRISDERLHNQRFNSRSMAHRISVRNSRSTSTERLSNQRSIAAHDQIVTVRDSRISAYRLSHRRDSIHSSERSSSYRNSREAYTERLISARSSRRTTVGHLSAIRNSRRVMNDNRFVRQNLPNYSVTRRTTTRAERHMPTFQSISRKFDMRLASGHLLNNKASQQELEVSQKQFVTADNTTLKTESLLGTGLSLETVKNTFEHFDLSQFMGKQNNWSANIYEYITNFLATLAVMWPALAICKGNMLESVGNYDVASILSTKMEHLNSFFTDKPSSNYALVPDSLALFDSAKTSPRDGMLNAVIGGGATVAFMLLSTKTK